MPAPTRPGPRPVRAIDSRSGFESRAGGSGEFLVVGRQYAMATLGINTPCRSSTIQAATLGKVGDSPLTVRTHRTLAMNLQATGVRQSDGSIAGSFTGVATYGDPFYFSCPGTIVWNVRSQ